MSPKNRRYRMKSEFQRRLAPVLTRLQRTSESLGIKARWPHMLLAFFLALLCWYTVAGSGETVETWVEVPVQFSGMPDSLIVLDGSINKLALYVRGPKGMLSRLEPMSLPYSIDARNFVPGRNEIVFSQDRVTAPPNIQIMSITPAKIDLLLDTRASKEQVPVKLTLPPEIKSKNELPVIEIHPELVTLTGPKSVLDGINVIKTRPIPYQPDENGFIENNIELDLPLKVNASPSSVSLRLKLPLRLKSVWVTVPVSIAAPFGVRVDLKQPEVKLLVRGPDYLVNDEESMARKIHLEAVIPHDITAGTRQLDYKVELPENCSLVEANPKTVRAAIILE